MAKTKKPNSPPPAESTVANIEETIVHVSGDVARVAKDYRVPIIVAAVLVVAIIGLVGLNGIYQRRQHEAINGRLHELLGRTDEEIRIDHEGFLADVKGTDFEPFAVLEISNWLIAQDSKEDRSQALALVRDAATRLPDSLLLSSRLSELEKAQADDASFTLPVPETPEPSEAGGEFPGGGIPGASPGEATGAEPVPTPPDGTQPADPPPAGTPAPEGDAGGTPPAETPPTPPDDGNR